MKQITVKQLIKKLEKIEDKNQTVRIKYFDWKGRNYFSRVKNIYENNDWTVIITNDK